MGEVVSSIFKLISDYEICIPAIQREYLYGSEDEKIQQLSKVLLKDITESLDSEMKKLNLGIIYGIVDNQNQHEIFYPLDGQQRLTTLFLLYWYLAIKNKETIEFIKFTYELRYSANSFFRELLNHNREEEFRKLLNVKNKNAFIESIKNKNWFKTQWFNDITVLSVINIIGEIIKLNLDNEKLKDYYNKLKQKESCPIYFYFLKEIDSKNDPYKNSAMNYIRINSRGKILETFENIKARMEIIERNLRNEDSIEREYFDETNLFTWKYDMEYIDLFYARAQNKKAAASLEEKTKMIDDETVNILINLYNILIFSTENKNLKLKQCPNKEYFYNIVYKISKNGFESNEKESLKKFGKEYFKFIDIIVNSINNDKSIEIYIKRIFEEVTEYSNTNEQNNILIAYIKYIYYYFIKHKKCVCKEKMMQLDYVLTNLNYKKWKTKKFHINDKIIEDMAQAEDVYCYFLSKEYTQIEEDFELKKNRFAIDDIRVRFKEQSIKFKIINEMNINGSDEKYYFFENIEKLSDNMRAIHYLLFISEMWNEDVSYEKIKPLLSYIKIAEIFFCSTTNASVLVWRKVLAIISNSSRGELLCSESINKGVNKHINGKNSWYWHNDFYYIDDKVSDNKDKLLEFKSKIRLVKDAYNFIINTNIVNITSEESQFNESEFNIWCKEKFDNSYNDCWLKYTVDRNYEELLLNKLSYNENTAIICIEVKNAIKSIHQDVNFFARVLLLDKVEERGGEYDRYVSSVWDYKSKRVSGSINNHKGIILSNLDKPIINQFAPSLLWFSIYEKYLFDDKYRYRYFFYCSYNVSVPNVENSVYFLEKDKIIIFQINDNVKYKEYEYVFGNSSAIQKVNITFKEFDEVVERYIRKSDFEDEKWIVYDYVYNYEWIHKCGYKVDNGKIGTAEFKKIKEGSLDFKKLHE